MLWAAVSLIGTNYALIPMLPATSRCLFVLLSARLPLHAGELDDSEHSASTMIHAFVRRWGSTLPTSNNTGVLS
jgi:hypothetical protein